MSNTSSLSDLSEKQLNIKDVVVDDDDDLLEEVIIAIETTKEESERDKMNITSSLSGLIEKQLNSKDVDDVGDDDVFEEVITVSDTTKEESERDKMNRTSSLDVVVDDDDEFEEVITVFETTKEESEKFINHYSNKHKILLVGEGDFSFAACLAKVFGDASNMIATSLDSEDEVGKKYSMGKGNLDVLKQRGCTILHEVDAHKMSKHPQLRNQLFDRIVFNFPHAVGHLWMYREHDSIQIEYHRDLVRGFFKSACKLMAGNGEVHVTHKTAHPFDRWYIEDLAEEEGLCLVAKDRFYLRDYPGYRNKKGEGHGTRCNKTFNVGECSTFKFGKQCY